MRKIPTFFVSPQKTRGYIGPNATVGKSRNKGHIFCRIMASRATPGDGVLCFGLYGGSCTGLFGVTDEV